MRLPVVTLALVGLMLAARAAMDLAAVPATDPGYVSAGARDTARILAGEPWRLLTGTVLHAGWKHLFYNTSALLVLGVLLEQPLGRVRFLGVFVATSVAGHLLSMALVAGEVSLGSSGGVYGLCGVLLTMLARRLPPFTEEAGTALWLLVAALAVGLVHGFVTPKIDGFAHLGGLLSGVALGLTLRGPRA